MVRVRIKGRMLDYFEKRVDVLVRRSRVWMVL